MLQRISTGCMVIDKSLGGGFPSGSISLVYGEAETGKTTLAMQCAVTCAGQGYKTLFVDADGTFSVRRLSQLASGQSNNIAELIVLMRPNDFREQATVIDGILNYMTKNLGLVVFDTITSLYRLRVAEFSSKTFELNRELNRQLAVLATMAKTQKVAVLVTSQVHSVLNEIPVGIEPVATRVLRFWADTVISIKPTENPKIISMILEKSPRRLPARICDLRIEEAGVRQCSIR